MPNGVDCNVTCEGLPHNSSFAQKASFFIQTSAFALLSYAYGQSASIQFFALISRSEAEFFQQVLINFPPAETGLCRTGKQGQFLQG